MVCVLADLTPAEGETRMPCSAEDCRGRTGPQIVSCEREGYMSNVRGEVTTGEEGGERQDVTRGKKVGRRVLLRIGRKTPNFFTLLPFDLSPVRSASTIDATLHMLFRFGSSRVEAGIRVTCQGIQRTMNAAEGAGALQELPSKCIASLHLLIQVYHDCENDCGHRIFLSTRRPQRKLRQFTAPLLERQQ